MPVMQQFMDCRLFPVNSVQPSTEETTEETTEEVKPDIIPGDVNEDKRVNVFDSVALRRMLLNNLIHPVPMVVLSTFSKSS